MGPGTSVRAGDVVRIRGERWRIVRRLAYERAAIVDTSGCDAANRGVRARFLLPCEPIDRIEVSSAPRVVSPAAWRRVARRVLGEASPSWTSLRAAATAGISIVPFQLEPALALMRGAGCRMLIADEVGLGKTIQAGLVIAEIVARRPDARAIVICPAGLRDQWRDELRSRFDLAADVVDAAAVARSSACLPIGMNPWSTWPLAIASIDYVKRAEVIRCFESLIWDVVVFDEAHALSGRSDRAMAARELGNRARCLLMLTATPHSGDDDAFQRMCGVGRLDDDGPLLMFRRTRADAGMESARRVSLLRVTPAHAESAMHAALREYSRNVWRHASDVHRGGARLATSVLMRRACSSAASLERSIERRIQLLDAGGGPPPAQLNFLFDPAPEEDDAPGDVLGGAGLADPHDERRQLERIRQLAREAARTESKLAALRRFILRTREPAIIFTEYRDTLERVAGMFPDVSTVLLHGGLTASQRSDSLRRFVDGSARLLLATDTASEGLNLQQRCRVVISLELPWNPLRLEQRAGRVDRIGQSHRVHAIHLVAGGTGEEFVLSRLVNRIRKIRAAVPSSLVGLPVEEEIAAAVIAGVPLAPVLQDPASEVSDVITADLRAEARHEAHRIEMARALLRGAGRSSPDSRPLVTSMRRRQSHMHQELFWLYRLVFTDARGCVISEPVLAFAAAPGRPLRLRRPDDLRSLLDVTRSPLLSQTSQHQHRQLDALAGDLTASLKQWARREHSIAVALRKRLARMSAGLLQLGLFDHRNQRAAAAQSALLDEALSKSTERISELSAAGRIEIESCDLVWAIALY